MQQNTTSIIIIEDKRSGIIFGMFVEPIAPDIFRAAENELYSDITIGTEFQTRINEEGNHEVLGILKTSPYQTRRFWLSTEVPLADYRLLGDEVIKHGGHWQVDMGSIATISLPLDCTLNLDDVFRTFNHWPKEIKD